MLRVLGVVAAILITALPGIASAQLWTPLDTVPKPNAIIAHDTSVTMGINTQCTGCHNRPNSRLEASKQDILQTLPLFRDYFTFGAFQYAGCEFAKITNRVLPTPDNPDVSYNQVIGTIAGADSCGSKEERLPGGEVTTCATPGCLGDNALVADLANLALPGFDPLAPFLHVDCIYNYVADFLPCVTDTGLPSDATGYRGGCYHIGCGDEGGIEGFIFALNQLPAIDWPRWTQSGVTPQQVKDELCDPVAAVLDQVYQQILACRPDNEFYLNNFQQSLSSSSWCVPGLIAQNACAPGSVLYNTCICDNANPACIGPGSPVSDCGTPFTWKARQQVAVCETYQPGGAFNSFFQSQPDNVVNGQCRENAALFFTDGYMGHTPGTAVESTRAIPAYRSVSGLSNMAVFRISDVFNDQANAMMSAVTNNVITTAYSALDQATMQESFSRLLNRIYKGVYTGSSIALDSQGTRAVFHSFTVPGYDATGPVSDSYLGWPARLSMYEITPEGDFEGPLWETDWADRVGAASGCGPTILGTTDTQKLGPGDAFRNGVQRSVGIGQNSIDRDGNGTVDDHPALRFGSMYSIAATRPVVVEAPREAPNSKYSAELSAFQTRREIRERIRAVYVMGNGYVHGFHGGSYQGGGDEYGYRQLAFSYADRNAPAGTEIMRYGPSWVAGQAGVNYRYDVNDLVQQPMTTGQLTARELRIRTGAGYEFRTVLVGAQGRNGRGYFALDVTEPCAPRVLAEWLLPDPRDRASGEPMIYMLPTGTADDRAAVITTGGLGGTSNLYSHDLTTGGLISQVALPGGASYLAAPICLDALGEGRLTHCYLLREDGRLLRADINPTGAFGAVRDITPPGIGGPGRRFTTNPAVFFDATGSVNLVFGSGDFERLTQTGSQNYVFKAIDRSVRRAGLPGTAADVDTACGNTGSGQIALRPGERVISPPVVAKGVVAWTTYLPTDNACASGQAYVYAMNYLSCLDAVDGAGPPEPRQIEDGLPSSPVLHRDSQKLLVGTSAGPTADQVTRVDVRTKGGARTWTKRLYWRTLIDAR